ncbi:hypothetical protein CAPTEDRAFT_204594, partial [Capitella teleta]
MHPKLNITINGQMISGKQSLINAVTITDEAGGKADQIDLSLVREGIDPPPAGASIEASFGVGDQMISLGAFKVDEVTTSGSKGGHKMSVKGTAADMGSGIKAERTEVYDGKTIAEIVESAAGRAGLEAVVAPAYQNQKLDQIHQRTESDMHLLTRLSKRFNATFKIADGKMIFTERGKGLGPDGKPRARITLTPDSLISYSWK